MILYVLVENTLKNKAYIPLEKFNKLMKSPGNIVEITEDNGEFHGRTINKALMVSSPAYEYSIEKYEKELNASLTEENYEKKYEEISFLRNSTIDQIVKRYFNLELPAKLLLENHEE